MRRADLCARGRLEVGFSSFSLLNRGNVRVVLLVQMANLEGRACGSSRLLRWSRS